MTENIQLLLTGLLLGGVYGLIALSLVLIYKSTRILNLAQGELGMMSAFIAWTFMVALGFPFWLSILLAMLCAAIVGILVERLLLRPLIGESLLAAVIMTLAFGYFLKGIIAMAWPGVTKSFPQFIPISSLQVGDFLISLHYLWCFGIAVLLFVALAFFFWSTRQGLSMRAVAEDHQVARSLGIRVTNTFAISWAIALALGAVAGVLLGSLGTISIVIGEIGLMKALPVMLLGGLESFIGALIGGIIIGIAETFGGVYVDPFVGGGFKDIVPFILMLLVLILKPHGLFGLKKIERM